MLGWRVQETWRNNACTWKTSFSRLQFWFILISFQKVFPKIWLAKLGVRLICGLYAADKFLSVAYTLVFTVIIEFVSFCSQRYVHWAVIKSWGPGIPISYFECGPWAIFMGKFKKQKNRKEIPSCLIPNRSCTCCIYPPIWSLIPRSHQSLNMF